MTEHLATITAAEGEIPVVVSDRGVAAIREIDPELAVTTIMDVIAGDHLARLRERVKNAPDLAFTRVDEVRFTAPYRSPRKIWGIGLNYGDHAADLSESAPDQPASFVKCDHTIIGPDEPIVIPAQSERTTSEAEIGLIIGRTCENVSESEAMDYVWGVTTILDQTAEDILRINPRYLTRSKNFRTFFCFGPELVPLDEVIEKFESLDDIEISTVKNGDEFRTNTVAHMTHKPASLVSFHSKMMPLFPGDIISTGTPGALVIGDGDRVECRIDGIGQLTTTARKATTR
ncbi:fumarylacetoacetate hydrolase family protein [Saccharopolyspora spinosa]|uniref:2-keto-4-pentenoate hydratase/2-oxohepta-3-ene-1,7-dioic acid hydratase in catechol pathway n=1 Tax=Saccharopolyspora spinosa TaxID=60894 RepID=A0A2N3Y6K5_SACSN|nr:fumarylacetoacetate hydrolase family protein [Saccharopolyspora spinosa]PKW18501.1 2-keto-4-pentenoate hydratase/2-oxohepta-3-ene-1,7-dioic acid hydratase in catechol pathway [Saccharopolyspora spinosa]